MNFELWLRRRRWCWQVVPEDDGFEDVLEDLESCWGR